MLLLASHHTVGLVLFGHDIAGRHLHWVWGVVAAASGAGALVAITAAALSSWRRCRDMYALFRDGLTCSDLVRKSREFKRVRGHQSRLEETSCILGAGLWFLLLPPAAIGVWVLTSSALAAAVVAVVGAAFLAALLPRAVTWREKRAGLALDQAIAVARRSHEWDGCRCRTCAVIREEGHQWKGCVCAACGSTRDEDHEWEGCKCTACGRERHQWQHCRCTQCGASRDSQHDYDGPRCRVCGHLSAGYARAAQLVECIARRQPAMYEARDELVRMGEAALPVVPLLIDTMAEAREDPPTAFRVIVGIGPPAIPVILKMLPAVRARYRVYESPWTGQPVDDNKTLRCLFAALGEMESAAREAIPVMLQIVREEHNYDVRAIALRNVLKIDRSCGPRLIALVTELRDAGSFSGDQARSLTDPDVSYSLAWEMRKMT